MPNFFDVFTGNTRSAAQGVATPDLPSDGARQTDIGRILEGISDAAETGSQFVNGFTSGSDGGKAVSRPVEIRQDSKPLLGLNINEPLGKLALVVIVAVVGFVLWRFSKK